MLLAAGFGMTFARAEDGPEPEGYDYEVLYAQALVGLVRDLLEDAEINGLPGDHHFFITFDMDDPGTAISNRLREKYLSPMTIILQYEFEDLHAGEAGFEVKLKFDGQQEYLYVPYSAIIGFNDPSEQFGMRLRPDPVAAAPEN